MTDPTPTRAEVERFDLVNVAYDLGEYVKRIEQQEGGRFVRWADHAALRERAEAAERLLAESRQHVIFWEAREVAARRAEAAAWNDAIEAAALWHQSEIARLKEQVSENNAYLARVGAASYDSDANRYCIDQISAHQQSVAAIRALRRAAPTEGEA